jgi:hypothetical protein
MEPSRKLKELMADLSLNPKGNLSWCARGTGTGWGMTLTFELPGYIMIARG